MEPITITPLELIKATMTDACREPLEITSKTTELVAEAIFYIMPEARRRPWSQLSPETQVIYRVAAAVALRELEAML